MIEMTYVVAFAMATVNLFKKYVPATSVPFLTIGIAVLLNLANAYFFGGVLVDAFKEALIASGIAVGMFVTGDAVRSSEKTPLKINR